MTIAITPGTRCLLDGKTEVIIVKSSNRSKTAYTIEIPGKSVELVSGERLTVLEQS